MSIQPTTSKDTRQPLMHAHAIMVHTPPRIPHKLRFFLFALTEHHFAAVANIVTPEDGRIRPKHIESYNTCNKAIHLCIKLDTHLPYFRGGSQALPLNELCLPNDKISVFTQKTEL
jgi:hypothetical protein